MTILTNAQVFDGSAMLPGRHDVRLDGKRIASVAPHTGWVSGDDADRAIDVGGMTVLPGLITCSPASGLLQVRHRCR